MADITVNGIKATVKCGNQTLSVILNNGRVNLPVYQKMKLDAFGLEDKLQAIRWTFEPDFNGSLSEPYANLYHFLIDSGMERPSAWQTCNLVEGIYQLHLLTTEFFINITREAGVFLEY